MNILHVTTAFKPAWETGGTVRVAYEIAQHTAELGHEVTVFTTDRGSSRHKVVRNTPIAVDGITVYYFKNFSRALEDHKIITPFSALRFVPRMMDGFDVVHIHEHRTVLAGIVSHYAKKKGIPYVVETHGSLGLSRGNSAAKSIFDSICGKRILSHADSCIAISSKEYDELQSAGAEKSKISIIPNGVRTDYSLDELSTGKFRAKYSIPTDSDIILYVGRIAKIKGLDLLLKSFSDSALDDTYLVITGPDDGDLARIQKLADEMGVNDRVIFTGPLYGIEKFTAFASGDVLVLPSEYEVFGNVIIEAGSVKTPSVIADTCDISRDLRKQNAALVFERNQTTFTKAIERILSDEELRRKIGENIYELAHNKYDWESLVENYLEEYRKIS